MTSISETGHAKNIANFQSLISFAKGYGSAYNPSKNQLKISELEALLADAQSTLHNVVAQYAAFNNAVNLRQTAFAGIKPLATRLINALQSTDASALVVKDAQTFNRKLQGKRTKTATPPILLDPNSPPPNTISASQQSYTNQIQHLAGIIAILSIEPNYAPNETALQITTLQYLQNQLTQLNNEVADSYTNISNARISRNAKLYNMPNNLCSIATEVKQYIKSLFGATSPEYAQVKSIPFRHYKY